MRHDHIPLKGGIEQDVHTGWRHVLSISTKDKRRAKRSHNKRVRKVGRMMTKAPSLQ